jgi:thiosulfate/3-mercaptopyruvate sulfurtransferase
MSAATSTRSDVLVSVEDLRWLIDNGAKVVILDVRFTPPGQGSRRSEFEQGHLPGAMFVEMNDDLQGEPIGFSGRRPLPPLELLQERVRRWGIDEDTNVVVAAAGASAAAGRAWFVLNWAGVPARLLDGGQEAWVAAGGNLSIEEPLAAAGTLTLTQTGLLPTIDADQVSEVGRAGLLLDARPASHHRGEGGQAGEAHGHIPGSISAPLGDLLDENGLVRDESFLRDFAERLGIDSAASVGLYCGGGVAAPFEALVLRTIGIEVPVYIGSWSAWVSDPSRPIATGA